MNPFKNQLSLSLVHAATIVKYFTVITQRLQSDQFQHSLESSLILNLPFRLRFSFETPEGSESHKESIQLLSRLNLQFYGSSQSSVCLIQVQALPSLFDLNREILLWSSLSKAYCSKEEQKNPNKLVAVRQEDAYHSIDNLVVTFSLEFYFLYF